MTLVYGKTSPTDVLAKAERDQAALEAAEATEDSAAMSDALFNLAVDLTSVKDWLKKHGSTAFTPSQVENLWKSSVALNSFRDIANGGKHRTITKYVPSTSEALVSVQSGPITVLEAGAKALERGKTYPRLKIIRADGTRHRAVDLGRTAIEECRTFMTEHSVV